MFYQLDKKLSDKGGKMVNIKFLDEESIKQADVKRISSNILEITGVDQNISGFHLITDNGGRLWKI